MIKFFSLSRSPATAAAGSAVLIVTALAGVILAAGIESGPSTAPGQAVSAPANVAPLVLPKPCVATRQHQTCAATGSRQHRAKQVKRQPAGLPAPTVVPSATGP